MILRALYDYYDRLNAWQEGFLAPIGFEDREIGFVIVIDRNGLFLDIEDSNNPEGGAQEFRVVQYIERTNNASEVACVFWDSPEYVINLSGKTIADEPQAKTRTFAAKVDSFCKLYPNNGEFKAVSLFYHKKEYLNPKLVESKEFKRIVSSETIVRNMSFKVEEQDDIVAAHDDLYDYVKKQYERKQYEPSERKNRGTCFVTGKTNMPMAKNSSVVKIFDSAATSKLLSYNFNSANSYGRKEIGNFPISIEADSKIYNAFRYLLRRGSESKQLYVTLAHANGKRRKNNTLLVNRTMLFWTSSNSIDSQKIEELVWDAIDNRDNPDLKTEQVKNLFNNILSGENPNVTKDNFYLLGLAPNRSRIVVVYWRECTLKEFAEKLKQHFFDTEVIDYRHKDRRGTFYQGMYSFLGSVVKDGRVSDLPPRIVEALMKSIIQGTPYPEALYQACLSRILAERKVTISRAALLKGYLNRKYMQSNNNNQIITPMLNKEETNQGYLCGRLFAVYEYAQESSLKAEGGKSTLRDRFFSSALTRPRTTFIELSKILNYYYSKISNQSLVKKLKNTEYEITEKFDSNSFPLTLNKDDQGRFVIGYYHQRGDFEYKPQNESNSKKNIEVEE
ncbi:MAG: type I-C CRISPR-associated protein Cas8c/Csd1 [Bacteroidales bacterium]|nr:type I-C CRISPR-associated protein Cas8c/Csd1 [Bacteroidales bacterium]